MASGAGSYWAPIEDIEGGNVADHPNAIIIDSVLIDDGTHVDDSATFSEGPYAEII